MLLEMGEEVLAIFTLPEERSDNISAYRGFDGLGKQYGVPVYQVSDINDEKNISIIKDLGPEVVYVIGWPQLVNNTILTTAPRGCVGIHSSLLPKYRGGAPVNWGLINGETEWGVTLMYLGEGPDIGDIIAQNQFPIDIRDTCQTVYDKATEASLHLLRDYVPLLAKGKAPRKPQDENQATLFPKRKPGEGIIDWDKTNTEIYNWVRALTHPYPGAFTYLPNGSKFFIWMAEAPGRTIPDMGRNGHKVPGSVVGLLPYRGLVVQTGDGKIVLVKVRQDGGMEMPASIWAAYNRDSISIKFVMK